MKISFQIEGASPAELAEIIRALGVPQVPLPAEEARRFGVPAPSPRVGGDLDSAYRDLEEKFRAAQTSPVAGDAPSTAASPAPRPAPEKLGSGGGGGSASGPAASPGEGAGVGAVSGRAGPAPAEREPGADDGAEADTGDDVFFRCQTVKSAIKILVERGITGYDDLQSKALDLMGQGVPVFEAVPADQIGDRVRSAMIGLGLPEET